MLYPHGAPHISEFRKVLAEEFGCEFKRDTFHFDDGVEFDYTYIERNVDGENRVYISDGYDDQMTVYSLLLASICKYLRLDCSRWGVTNWDTSTEDE